MDPLWYKDAVIYETHVKAFFDSDGDGIGDFAGLLQKLDYLSDLGITCIWLLPFFPSPLRDDGYDIADYTNVHPSYGTLEDFRRFLAAAHNRNLKVIIELVVNHTSDQHPWFQAARTAPVNSDERNLYVWSDTEEKYSNVRIIFTDTEKSNWTADPIARAYYWHRFFSHQPDLNFDNPVVLHRILEAMNFWLDMGVDGLRLDAIPYLVEREGTSCENLPETHAVIKQIRKALDDRYEGRMLLAEANQWPTDVRPYFGEGDECHMAFHFPLMPRMFMALRMEDRYPITDIMSQTPEIPLNCQWGLFLRNHDELTLEMVTDDERDYMYIAYSADPKMKLNVGIRRRLAPLMDNNRRRIELLNRLLFSFPGTPIIYYGDEIGMGDNIYLGDRDGVRTPMQWNSDRNGGFSRANPGRLYSPPIMDPVYGYEAVNVEAELSDSSSLLHWMRNMIALRKLFAVFGRGEIEFLHPQNRKVLVYLRKYESDQILCIANLSRFAQAVEVDLSFFAGMRPVEMFGYTEFPVIGRNPYQLSLNPYGFFWFELQGTPAAVEVEMAQAEPLVSLSAGNWKELFESETGEILENQVLTHFAARQRWFLGDPKSIDSIHIQDWAELGSTGSAALALVRIRYSDGVRETYLLPLTIEIERHAHILESLPERVLCRLNTPKGVGVLYDGCAHEETCRALLALMDAGSFNTRRGTMRPKPSGAFRTLRETVKDVPEVRLGSAEQANTSLSFDGKLMLKLYRKLEMGVNAEAEMREYLMNAGFSGVPTFGGVLEYVDSTGDPFTLAILQAVVEHQGDGVQFTMEEVSRYYEQYASIEQEMINVAGPVTMDQHPAQEIIGLSLDAAATLGRRTAELHLSLLPTRGDPAFDPEPFSPHDLATLIAKVSVDFKEALSLLQANLPNFSDDVAALAQRTIDRQAAIVGHLTHLESLSVHALKIRIHGDYHLGRVLRVRNDYAIGDFDGDPSPGMADRRAKTSPLKDIATMMRSFRDIAYLGLINHTHRRPAEFPQLLPYARRWALKVSAAFQADYLERAGDAGFIPQKSELRPLLSLFMLEDVLSGVRRWMNADPKTVNVRLQGILDVVDDSVDL